VRNNLIFAGEYPTLIAGSQAIDKYPLTPWRNISRRFVFNDEIEVARPHRAGEKFVLWSVG
jgi:hypothetical protein